MDGWTSDGENGLFDFNYTLFNLSSRANCFSCLVLIHDKVLGQYVGVTQALQHGIHEASVSVIPQTSYARRLICGPLMVVVVPTQRWNTVILLLLLLHGNR